MGLFSKKDYVCEKCGKTFQKRLNLNGNLCDECFNFEASEKMQLRKTISGYIDYANEVFGKSYSSDEMRQIIDYRESLLKKFENEWGITRADLQNASDNYRKLTDAQAEEVILRVARSSVSATTGAVYSDYFFFPTKYDGVIVDVDDVFAVGICSDDRSSDENNEGLLCVLFTNDPYIPVFPMVYLGKKRMFEVLKSKKGRQAVVDLFSMQCPNLTYPVDSINALKKTVKKEGEVRGNIELEFMLDTLGEASACIGMFNTKDLTHLMPPTSVTLLDRLGYILSDEVDLILKMDKMFNKKFWQKHIDNVIRKTNR